MGRTASIFLATGVVHYQTVFLIICIILCCNSLWIATGIYFSLRMSKTTVAVVYNLLLAPLLYGLHVTHARFEDTGASLSHLPTLRARVAQMRVETDGARAHLAAWS